MDPNSPRKIQFTVPLLEPHLDPEAAEQIRRRRPTPATLVLSGDQSSPEIDEDRMPNPLLKSTLVMSPRQRTKVTRITPTMKELQLMVEHHLCKQQQEVEGDGCSESQDSSAEIPSPESCCQGHLDPSPAPTKTDTYSHFAQDHAEADNRLTVTESGGLEPLKCEVSAGRLKRSDPRDCTRTCRRAI
ncbi:protein phosphatase 1 regulatory subunit 1A [Rhinatrema bivittatum]|uniref:protein phosphatase 1 regulatory subunit 1A n=1 Tax=Rhinatrema bivittatum TaxID=194408 RepID=UPI001126B74F|nr:protein phosphatase 1 regulatory subunit 1A [Rhinatrema bivittatum]